MTVRSHSQYDRIEARLRSGPIRVLACSGQIFRYATPKYARSDDVASGWGSQQHGGRWNPPGSFRAVYGSLDDRTAREELRAQAAYYGLGLSDLLPRVLVAISVTLHQLLDLSDGAVRRRLQVSQARMMREDWRARLSDGEEALTQAIGRAAYAVGFEGMKVPSAAHPSGINLVIFPDNLSSQSTLAPHGVSLSVWPTTPAAS